ncbi:MAG: sulfatase-like hydrolase/transferase [Verrucomicrobiae bacterium]|nr:sulfatase-like hydrolase/transferase [Verrucomicrobiae bacterium]
MSAKDKLAFLIALMFLGSAAATLAQKGTKPNLLFILTDQHRRDGVGAYEMAPVKTPNLDRLAAEGIRFNRAYTAQPVCAPNRAAIMSGLYPHNHGVLENTWDMNSDIPILPDLFRRHGYRTGYFGKWHLGDPARDAWDVMPIYPGDGRGKGHYFEENGKQVYQTDIISRDAINFMKAASGKPFCLFASFYPPHPPYSVPEKYEALYADIFPNDEHRRKYYAMCSAVDEAAGKLLNALDELDIAKNTLVVFTTEHGHQFEHRWNDHDKRLCYDIAARVPLLMRFPGVIPDGQVSDALFSAVDLYPTMATLLGLSYEKRLDGVNLSNQITQRTDKGRANLVMVNVPFIDKEPNPNRPAFEKGEERCVIEGDWKLILSTVREPELYNLTEDPAEVNNCWVAMRNTATVGKLKEALTTWSGWTDDKLAPSLLEEIE